VLDVGDLVGVRAGGNPHRWYSPTDVDRVARAIADDLTRLDPAHAAGYRARVARFRAQRLAEYTRLIASIRQRYRGIPVGASESIFTPLAHALRLDLTTPPTFLKAVSEGTEPTAADTAAIERQIAHGRIRVWVVNRQNATPDVTRLTEAARAAGIPVVPITETISPASATFEAWQARQLRALAAALGRATGR
jgi:zinc/manganese transport system substrate-binding protein